jgi:HK97 family phage major capsid protein
MDNRLVNIRELRQELSILCDNQEAVVNKVIAEKRSMSEEENNQFNELQVKIDELNKTIAAAEVIEARALALEQSRFGTAKVHNRASDEPWKSFGHQLMAVRSAAEPGVEPRDWDPRLKIVAAATGVGATPADGGFLVMPTVATEIISKGYKQSILAPLCRKIPIGENSDMLSVNVVDENSRATGSRWGGIQMYWRGEADTVDPKQFRLRRVDMQLESLMGLCYPTNEMLRDATQLGAIIQQAYTEEVAWMLDDGIVNGNGVGKLLGILNSDALITVDKEVGQAAATVVTKNLSKMWARLWARSRQNAVWLINQDIEPELDELVIPVGTGGVEPRFITYGPEGTLRIKGRPVIAIEQAATLGTKGDIILADLSQYVLIDKDNIEMAESMHVRFLYAENVYRFMYRVNGRPYWTSVLTPANGSATQSPQIALQTRA